jgi:uncharacterized protein YjbI with pentapeptide repeats
VKLSDVLQIVSLIAVVVALLLNYRQARETGRQAQETARQVQISNLALKHDSYRQSITNNTSFKNAIFLQHPPMLEWYLSSRSIPPGTYDDNLKLIYLFRQFDVHESVFMAHHADALPPEAWVAWVEVIKTDVEIPEFDTVWIKVRHSYVVEYVAFVESLRQARDAAATQEKADLAQADLVQADLAQADPVQADPAKS